METIMELDDLKTTWQTLDRHLERRNAIDLQLFHDRKLDKARNSLRPLFWGQLLQMLLIGVPFVLLAAALWVQAGADAVTLSMPLLAAGIFVHAYGVAAIVLAGCTLGLIQSINYSAPVLTIEKQLAKLRRFYVFNSMMVGLPWWLIWVPVLMVLAGIAGVDLYAQAASVVWIGLGIGFAGLLATWWFHRWSRDPRRARLGKRLDDSATGGSILKMQGILDEIRRFEQE